MRAVRARYRIVREWFRVSTREALEESVSLKRDGELVGDIDSLHWQDFIQELLPLGVSDLFFFDGEKVQLLADDGSDASTLAKPSVIFSVPTSLRDSMQISRFIYLEECKKLMQVTPVSRNAVPPQDSR